jgi:hypothetical protein
MARISRSKASLRIFGDDLDPADISVKLGCGPTSSSTKGEHIVGKHTGTVQIAKTGVWRLAAQSREPADLDGQIEELFAGLTKDMAIWNEFAGKYELNLFVGLFMRGGNEGIKIKVESLNLLAERGVEFWLDIYDSIEPRQFCILNQSSSKSVSGDVTLFSTIDGLTRSVEAIDVRNGEYSCFTSEGREVVLSAASDYGLVSATAESSPQHEEEAKLVLRGYLMQLAESGSFDIGSGVLEEASLTDLEPVFS